MNNVNRKMRKMGSRDETRIFSQQSVLSAMDRFVLAVENMNETVMVPSRLMDMSAMNNTNANEMNTNNSVVPVSAVDLHGFYTMLNSVKTELIWGSRVDNKEQQQQQQRTSPAVISRRLSTVSSLSLSDSEPDTESCSESDSSPDSSLEYDDRSSSIACNFRHHLMGLYDVLQQLTDTAEILTCRYQDEVGGQS